MVEVVGREFHNPVSPSGGEVKVYVSPLAGGETYTVPPVSPLARSGRRAFYFAPNSASLVCRGRRGRSLTNSG